MKKTFLALTVSLVLVSNLVGANQESDADAVIQQMQDLNSNARQQSDAERLESLFDLHFEYSILAYPENATYVGDPRGQDRWTDYSEEGLKKAQAAENLMLEILEGIDSALLNSAQKENYDLLLMLTSLAIEENEFPTEYLPLNQMSGPQQSIAQLFSIANPRSVNDYENMIKRLQASGVMLDQQIALMRKGLEAGVTPPQITLRDVPQQVRNQLVDDPANSPVLLSFQSFPKSIDSLQQERLKQQAESAFTDVLAPAYERLLDFLEDEYIPGARTSVGLGDAPNGKDWYEFNVRKRTTLDLSPEAIHSVGLAEVARIRSQMEEIIKSTGFDGDFAAFLEFLRTDPQFYHTTKEGLLREYRDIAKRADPEIMKLFGHLPRAPYGVIPIPSYAEKSLTTAYYMASSVEAGRPGYFYANTYALDTRPRWEMEALTLHEAVPGHHLQIAIQDELEDVPRFRQYADFTGFTEGWGLYSESLGEEMGFYQDPYSKFGQLTYEMWRAIRLVVDTGMHRLGWSRQQAIDYFKENAGKQEHDIIVEIDRYIVWPGQALAYKLGELKIKELRAWSTQELGEDFDIRGFHDVVLGRGAIPLDMMELNVRQWVQEQKSK